MKQSKLTNLIVSCLAIAGLFTFFAVNLISSNENSEIESIESLTYAVSKSEAAERARDFVASAYELSPSGAFVMMQSETKLQGYLLKNDAADQFPPEIAEQYPIDYYQVEVKTEEGPAYLVNVHTDSGKIVGWSKVSWEKAPVRNGEQIARDFMKNRGVDLTDWRLVPNDHAGEYVFASPVDALSDVSVQLHIGIENRQIVAVHSTFVVPQDYVKWVSGQDVSAGIMSVLYLLSNVFFGIAAIVLCVIYRDQISFTRGTILTTIFLLIYCMNNVNMYPAYRTMMAGESESAVTAMITVLFSQFFSFAMAALVYLTLISGDGLWRKMGRPLWAKWQDADYGSHVMRSVGYGYLFCLMLLGLQQLLFWTGEQYFDVWSVNDPMFSSANQLWPLLAPLLAWAAAISEEAIFRLFGMGIFKRWFKSSIVAAVLTSMIWAIGHTSYPIYPAYTRFVEVTIIGLVFAFIFLKFGFITAVFTHASFNSILMGISLMFTVTGSQALLGLVYIASPVIVGLILYLLHSIARNRMRLAPSPHLDT